MKDLKNVSRLGGWKDSAETINYNFSALGINIEAILEDIQRCKGLFPSLSTLKARYPNPEDGSWAYVGTRWPAKIYISVRGQWIDTGLTGSLDVDLEKYLRSEEWDEPVEDLFKITMKWIYKSNHSSGWSNVSVILIHPDDAIYTIRPKSLIFGYEGELLEKTITDAYLMEFLRDSGASFVSVRIKSSDGIEKVFIGGDLSWDIDQSYFYQEIDGVRTPRPPVDDDYIWVEFRFKDKEGDEYTTNQFFKFVLP